MTKIRTAPRCVQCHSECPNGMKDMPLAIICQCPGCPNYGLMQAGLDVMELLDKEFPFKEKETLAYSPFSDTPFQSKD